MKLLKDETIASAGMTYSSPTDSGTNTSHSINRTFFSNGDLYTESLAGTVTTYAWHTTGSSKGEIDTVTDAGGKITTHTNYKRGVPQNVAYPLNVSTSRIINNTGTVESETDALSRMTAYVYDSNNELTSIATPRTDDYNISIVRGDPAVTPPLGSTESKRTRTLTRDIYKEVRVYDGFGNLRQTKLTDTNSGILLYRKFQLDAEGRVYRAYLPSNTVSPTSYEQYQYDALGRLKTVTHPDGTTVHHDYLSNNKRAITNERGYITTYSYRSYGNPEQSELIKIEARKSTSPQDLSVETTDIARNKVGQVTSITQGGIARTYKYNNKFLLAYEVDAELGTIVYGRDAVGNLISKEVRPNPATAGPATTYVLNDLYRLTSILYPDATPSVSNSYYADGSLESTTKGAFRWDYLYDSNNNLKEEKATFDGTSYRLIYTPNSRDALANIEYPSGLVISYFPNAFGQPTKVTSVLGEHVKDITYFPNGQIDTFKTADGYDSNYGQNTKQLLSTLQVNGVRNGVGANLIDLDYRYDSAGNTEYIYDYRDTTKHRSMTYDSVNRLLTASGPYGVGGASGSSSFSYDARGNLLTKTSPLQSPTYTYNATTGRLDSITQSGGSTMPYSYDTYGNVIANGRNQFGYGVFTYDAESNLTQVGNPAKISYGYDGNNRMAREMRSDGSSTRCTADRNDACTTSILSTTRPSTTSTSAADLLQIDPGARARPIRIATVFPTAMSGEAA